MKKTPSLFKRDYEGTRQIYDEIVPGCEWVANGEGVATLKIDGTSCLIEDGKLFKRHEVKKGKKTPENFRPAGEPDPETGDVVGWVPVVDGDPASKYHVEAFAEFLENGTYELIGPKIQSNPYGLTNHILCRHGAVKFKADPPRTFADLEVFFASHAIEGIVWHHPDGRLCKIKRRDFGYKWPDGTPTLMDA